MCWSLIFTNIESSLTWRTHTQREPSPTFFLFGKLRTHGGQEQECVRVIIYKEQRKACVTSVKWMSAGKQQLQYNLMGNKFPFLLSTWPPTTNPEAWRVVNFHGKVVNFNKQQPFLCFGRSSHRHLYFLPGLKCLNSIQGKWEKRCLVDFVAHCASAPAFHFQVCTLPLLLFSALLIHFNRKICDFFC